jgi:hypothetical protein
MIKTFWAMPKSVLANDQKTILINLFGNQKKINYLN